MNEYLDEVWLGCNYLLKTNMTVIYISYHEQVIYTVVANIIFFHDSSKNSETYFDTQQAS